MGCDSGKDPSVFPRVCLINGKRAAAVRKEPSDYASGCGQESGLDRTCLSDRPGKAITERHNR